MPHSEHHAPALSQMRGSAETCAVAHMDFGSRRSSRQLNRSRRVRGRSRPSLRGRTNSPSRLLLIRRYRPLTLGYHARSASPFTAAPGFPAVGFPLGRTSSRGRASSVRFGAAQSPGSAPTVLHLCHRPRRDTRPSQRGRARPFPLARPDVCFQLPSADDLQHLPAVWARRSRRPSLVLLGGVALDLSCSTMERRPAPLQSGEVGLTRELPPPCTSDVAAGGALVVPDAQRLLATTKSPHRSPLVPRCPRSPCASGYPGQRRAKPPVTPSDLARGGRAAAEARSCCRVQAGWAGDA